MRNPSHEKFYYLELLRAPDGWYSVQTNRSSVCAFQKRRAGAPRVSSHFWRRPGAVRIAHLGLALLTVAKCWRLAIAEVANQLQSEAQADVILFGTAAEALSRPHFQRDRPTSYRSQPENRNPDLPALAIPVPIFSLA